MRRGRRGIFKTPVRGTGPLYVKQRQLSCPTTSKMLTYTREWALANPERVQALLLTSVECPICLLPFDPGRTRQSPMQGNFPTTCCHVMCLECTLQIDEQPREQHRCPICRADIGHWLADKWNWPMWSSSLCWS